MSEWIDKEQARIKTVHFEITVRGKKENKVEDKQEQFSRADLE